MRVRVRLNLIRNGDRGNSVMDFTGAWTRLFGDISQSDMAGIGFVALGAGLGLGLSVFVLTKVRKAHRASTTIDQGDLALTTLRLERDRLAMMLMTDTPLIVTWSDPATDPEFTGDATRLADATGGANPLAFGQWLGFAVFAGIKIISGGHDATKLISDFALA